MVESWRLLDLGPVDGFTMTNLYEVVGKAVSLGSSPNTVILNHPKSPFVNIGYHQIMEKEINIEVVRKMGLDLIRRSIGGGAILDGPWEQDYFIIVNRRSHECPATIPEFYSRFLKPTIGALHCLGLEAEAAKLNDVTVGGKKISGNGAITIDSANVLAGDILINAPTDLMSKIINSPSEKFRDKLASSMSEWLTCLESELGSAPMREEVKRSYLNAFSVEFGAELVTSSLTYEEQRGLDDLLVERKSPSWIFEKDEVFRRVLEEGARATKVKEGVSVCEAVFKAMKLIRVTYIAREGFIHAISISGDFFTQPFVGAVRQLEGALVGAPLDEYGLRQAIDAAFAKTGVKVFGASSGDFSTAILKAKECIRELS